MVTQAEFDKWVKDEDIDTTPVENGHKFGSSNPWDSPENDDDNGTVRLIDGIIHIDWIDGGWNGYGEEQFDSIAEFAARWTDVMQNGLTG